MIFVDTGAFLGRYLAHDQYHRAAVRGWGSLAEERRRCFTSNFVLDELFTLIGRRAGYRFAAKRAHAIYASDMLTILRPDHSDELAALTQFEKLADQCVSYTDCISFRLMTRHGIREVFSFDRHFQHAGFAPWPSAENVSASSLAFPGR